MSLQGPIVVVAEQPAAPLIQALAGAGAFPVIEATWADAANAVRSIKPSAVVIAEPATVDPAGAKALAGEVARAEPFLPVFARVRGDDACALEGALPVAADAPTDRLIAQIAAALRLRALHATAHGRARALKTERNIVAELPASDALDDATVLVVGRGRSHPALSVAVVGSAYSSSTFTWTSGPEYLIALSTRFDTTALRSSSSPRTR